MIPHLLKRKFGSGEKEAFAAQLLCWAAILVIPVLISPRLAEMELTEWQLLMTVIAGSSLMLLLATLSFLIGMLRSKTKTA